jgi:multidrug efflux pump subunit AcrA (membrane-fusion protein)
MQIKEVILGGIIMGKMKKRKKVIIFISLVVVAAVIFGIRTFSARRETGAPVMGYTVLSKTELINSVAVSGNIKSESAQNVYSTLNYPVKEIYVSVGDKVSAGDKLAKLDTASLELDIAQQRSTIDNSKKTSAIDLENKKRTYENTKSQYQSGLNSELINAENNLKTAEIDLKTKKTTYENNKLLYESGAISKQELDQSETNYTSAVNNYNNAETTLKITKTNVEQDIKTAEANLKTAETNYNNDSQQIALQKLNENLRDSIIKSPINGTVTAVYAVVGSSGNGLLFVVEDIDKLAITTYVKEYDAGQVQPGQLVTIKTDATGDEILNGKVVKISPASTKNTAGATDTSSTVEFETEVSILDHNEKLKIGMNARMDIILEKKSQVYAVPYDAITVDAKGQNIVYIVSEENEKQIIKEIPVEIGLETDLYNEISGDGLADGVKVINDAASVKPGEVAKTQTTSQGSR